MTKDAQFLIDACKSAAELITDEFVVNSKNENGDLVTNFDLEVENFLIERLRGEYPNFEIVSEEYNPDVNGGENYFTIDPIDGTVNFAHGLPLWAITVAMVRDGKLVACVIYAPKLNELYYADESGAYLNDKKISVNKLPLEKAVFCLKDSYKDRLIQKALLTEKAIFLKERKIVCAALLSAWVAAGRVGIAMFGTKIWDYLPGKFLVEQAGGAACILGKKFENDDKSMLYMVANSKELLEEIKG